MVGLTDRIAVSITEGPDDDGEWVIRIKLTDKRTGNHFTVLEDTEEGMARFIAEWRGVPASP